jgi:amino acid adenylation domain-containing protein
MGTNEGSGRAEAVSAAKRALLQKRLRGGFAAAAERQAIPRRAEDGPAPLSFAQRRVWFLEQMEPGTPLHNLPGAFRLRAALDPAVLRRAATEVTRRHDALRAVFSQEGGEPTQTAAPARPVPVPVADLSRLEGAAREAEARRLIAAEAARPFDLGAGLLARVGLLRLGAEEQVLLVTHHHIASDGWSMSLFLGEMLEAYRALLAGAAPSLPELPVRFADFAAWQREALGAEAPVGDLAWWRGHLAGAPSLLDIPTDRPRPAVQTTAGAIHVFDFPPELLERVQALARAEGATPFMALLAAFTVLLSRWSGQEDVVVGSPVGGRTRSETERLVGFFANTLPLRTDLSGDPSFRELLGRVRETTLGAYAHQEVPFERMVETLRVERSLAHAPVFQVMFTLQNNPGIVEVAGFRLEPEDAESGTAKFDLTFGLEEREGRLEGIVEYATALFDADTVARMVGWYRTLLEGIVADPSLPVAALPLLAPDERARLLSGWSEGPPADAAAGVCLHELFEAQARRTPDAVALLAGGGRVTYAELDARASALAAELRARGVVPEVRVGVCTGRGAEMVVAVLGVLKAGGAYVPLDPAYPRERLELVLEDAAVPVVVATAEVVDALPEFGGEVVLVRTGAEDRQHGDSPPPARGRVASLSEPGGGDPEDASGVSPDNAAYVIYTSGSTGRPKGVAVPHRAVVNFLASMRERPGLAADDTLLAVTTLAFDIAGLELFLPLSVGARVALADRETAADGRLLAAALAETNATTLQATPATWRMLLESGWKGSPGLRALCGGEALPRELAERLLPSLGELWNLYGPTETTVYSMVERVEPGEGPVPVGRPVASTRVYLLDGRLEPVPAGFAGEVYIGGEGVARGYLGRPDATAGAFVPDPFAGEAGARMYRTGDRARWLAARGLEFLGRVDHQVKVRGFRIEPGEIESALLAHPAVRECVVVARGDAPGGVRLVAYVGVGEAVEAPDAAELRRHLRASLPEHMVPSLFVALPALPLTPNGKIDRKALPAPEAGGAAAEHVEPRGETEETIAAAWRELLRAERVGARDDFFELGGHSLLATQVVARIRDRLGVELPVRAVFEAPTVAGLAARVDALRDGVGEPADGRIPAVPGPRRFPLSFSQERLWFLHRLDPASPVYNIPVALRLSGALDAAALERALSEVVRRHEMLRTVFAESDGVAVQVVQPDADVRLPVADLAAEGRERAEAEATRLAREEAARPFDLAAGPVFRASLLRLAGDEHVLLLTLHHVAGDAWSVGVLLDELAAAYRGESPADLPVQYGDFAAWQRARLSGGVLDAQLAWWRGHLAGAPAALDLPTDRPRPREQSHRGASHAFTLPAELADAVAALARREGATPFMVLLAAWQTLLARWSGQDDVVVGSPIAGRTRAETEGLVGFFVNTLALRTELSGRPSFRQVVARVREATLGAFAHQELPFERLVEELGAERDAGRNPVFQVMLALQNTPGAAEIDLGGVRARVEEPEAATAKFDLTLAMVERGGRLDAVLEYATDLFDRATVRRMADHLGVLLRSAAADPDAPAAALAILPEEERRLVVERWNDTAADFPPTPVHLLVTEQAERTPDVVAVAAAGASVTYAELTARAAALADHLRALGVGPESRVGICMERSAEMVVALLATLRAGAAYVPLDPEYPAERVAYMLADSGAQVLLTQEHLRPTLPEFGGRIVIVETPEGQEALPQNWGRVASLSEPGGGHPADVSGVTVDPESLAYVIYTSGSTGLPKGVAVPHGALANHTRWMQREFTLSPGDRVLQKTPFSFDASIWEFWSTLAAGATLVMAEPGAHREPARLARALADRGITVAQFVPSLLSAVLEEDVSAWTAARRVFCGGEALPAELAARCRALLGAEVVNLYGPTEACIDATFAVAPGESDGSGRSVPIGRAVANARAYVLDPEGAPAPVGVPGELHLGGAGLARGYVGRPDATAERWVPDALSGEAGARLYRTGDRVRRLASGALEWLGRTDEQVKVRGFRVEPGEVEAALLAHPAVREAVVAVCGEGGDARLVGWVVPAGDSLSMDDVRRWLAARLPAHVVPSALMALDTLPLTPGGKLDRRALPAPDASTLSGEAGQRPRTVEEETLAGIWATVLGVQPGVRDDFFALGGHSLLAARVAARVRQAFGVELPLRAVFDAPTLEALAARVAEARRAGGDPLPPLRRVPRDGPLPASFAQERLWVIDRMEPGSAAYNIPAVLRLSGRLDAAALEAALSAVVRRHESLRTTFAEADGRPVQVIHPPRPVVLPTEDLSALAPAERDAAARRLAAEEAARHFDLAAGPLLRAALLRLGGEEHVLLLTLHHAVGDAWSTSVLLGDLASAYGGAELPEPEVQPADFAAWQRARLTGDVLDRHRRWWRERLAGAPPALELPADRPRPAVWSGRGASLAFSLPPETSRGVLALARAEGATPFMVLLAAWQALLARWSGQDDVVVGTPVAGRTAAETEPLVGFFVNTLALRTDLSGDPPFRDVVARARDAALGALAHQELPFERLVEELGVERDLARNPVFQAVFALQNTPALPVEMGGVRLEAESAETATAKFDLALTIAEDGGRFEAALEYATDLFDRETAGRLAAHFRALLEGIVADPSRRLSDLPLAGADEARLLEAWSRGPAPSSGPWTPVHERVLARAAEAPDAVAVVAGGARLTYGELARRSAAVAARLAAGGAGPETRVALLAERSPELVAGMLAVLRAGAAYLPIDPSTPDERIARILADAQVPLVLTMTPLSGRLAGFPGTVIPLDTPEEHDDPEAGAAVAGCPLSPVPCPLSLAYVIYTSGSTGTPKGVAVTHGGLANLVDWHLAEFGVTAADRATQLAGLGFDASVWESWPYLAAGATLHLVADEETRTSPEALRDLLIDRGITLAFAPTALAEGLLALEWPRATALRALLAGGDALRVRPAPDAPFALVNNYGPTESTVVATSGAVGAGETGRAPWIGRPIRGVRALVLDAALRPAPVGVPGELCLGGAGVARGYLGRPEATAAAFVPDPSAGEPGARMYRTGDRARWLPGGELEFLGRVDQQVKVRGFRIEPGEVEAALLSHPGVREAVVVAREDGPGGRRLVAYVVGEDGAADSLRAHLRAALPEYMVPAAFVALPALPLTSSGKTDRRALPAPAADVERGAADAPRTVTEELLAGIWAELLGGEPGAHDDFFALGGHSLLAAQVVSRVRAVLGVELPLRALFEAPTVAGLAARIDGAAREPAPPVEPAPRDGPLPLSFAQERLWFLAQLEAETAAYAVPGALRLRGVLDAAALAGSLAEIVRRHEALRTTFGFVAGRPVQVVAPPGGLDVPVTDLSALPAGEREEAMLGLAREQTVRPFDLARGPLFRARLVRLDAEEHVLLLALHHIVSDGWSMGVLFRELSALYAALSRGEPSPLPPLPVQYADFALWQRRRLSDGTLERQLAWWRERLAGAPPLLSLPTDRPRPPVQRFRGALVRRWLPGAVAEGVRALARREGATSFMAFLAAFQALLARCSGQDDVSVGIQAAGRTRAETEGLIGFFVNTLVHRGDLSDDPAFAALLARAREAALGAHAHQDVPFDRVVEALEPERTLSYTPLFQVQLVFQNVPGLAVELPGLSIAGVDVDQGTNKFDLSLYVQETPSGTRAMLGYDTDLFDAGTAERMLARLERLLAGALADPSRPVATLPLLDEAERAEVVHGWNRTEAEYPREACLHTLFEAQARRAPDATALRFLGRSMSYGELDRRANRLARWLRGRGVGPEATVGICMERGLEMMVAVLGILKAGGAYVPVDPLFPEDRIAFTLRDAGVRTVLTQESVRDSVPAGLEAVRLDADAAVFAGEPDTAPEVPVTSANLAYVLYTSGSTGRPKGVLVAHRGMVNLVTDQARTFGCGPGDRVLHFAPLHFDASAAEIFMALGSGATVVMGTRESVLPGHELVRLMTEERVTNAKFTPSALAALPEAELPDLRVVLAGGEAVPAELVRRWGPGRDFWNVYGPTENSVRISFGRCRPEEERIPPIGRPLANVRAYVLDRHLEPAPPGIPGELYSAGDGVTRGYLGRPELTAERYLPDPFGPPGGRLYRTGDLARWRADGQLEYIGRTDFQVKIRGFRIEPGEVEAVLARYPAVHECAVVARDEGRGPYLAGYVVAVEGARPAPAELRAFLRERLPEYMVPPGIVLLDAIPLGPSGKLDRRALPAPVLEADGGFVAPREGLQAAIAGVWGEVLGVDRVGAADNFFEIGGHSLLLVRLHARLREVLGREVPIVDLFRFPTIASLAAHLEPPAEAEAPDPRGRDRAAMRRAMSRRRG